LDCGGLMPLWDSKARLTPRTPKIRSLGKLIKDSEYQFFFVS
jgi:hypothetical protein